MKLATEAREIERGTDNSEELTFGIAAENMGLVLGILRSKLYSDPIAAICREIASNARDANREADKGDVPIRVQLPTRFDPHFRVTDDGPGISPDRIRRIFVNFGSSTKRDDNTQTGGFGLGAKTPFAYADQFTVTTVHNGVRRVYTAFLDESQRGALTLMSEAVTDAPSGTSIAIPVRHEHGTTFRDKLVAACRHWAVRPTVTPAVQWPANGSIVIEGKGWRTYRHAASYGSDGPITLLIDGIAYPCPIDQLAFGRSNCPILGYGYSKTTYIEFANGDLPLSANRETIHWTDDAKALVRDRVLAVGAEVTSRLQSEIEACETWIDARQRSYDLRQVFDCTNGLTTWRGVPLTDAEYVSDMVSYTLPSWERVKSNRRIVPAWDALVMVNDTPAAKLSLDRIKKAYAAIPWRNYAKIYVVNAIPNSLRGLVPHVNLSDLLTVKDTKPSKPARRLYRYERAAWRIATAKEWDETRRARVYVELKRDKWSGKLDTADPVRALDEVAVYGFPVGEADYSEYKAEGTSFADYVASIAAKHDLQALVNSYTSEIDRSYYSAAKYLGIMASYIAAVDARAEHCATYGELEALGVTFPSPNGPSPESVIASKAISAILASKPLLKYARDDYQDPAWKDYVR